AGPDPTDALSSVPAAGSRRGTPPVGRLKFCYGPMDCGKSTLALQIDHNHARQGRRGLVRERQDRARAPQIASRSGATRQGAEGGQFRSPGRVDQLAELADEVEIDVYCFGIATDFRSRLFPGAARLFELADELQPVQVEVLCWCGLSGRFNARVVDGEVVREG